MRDVDRQMRDGLVEVLREFHVPFEEQAGDNPSLSFQTNGTTRRYPYKGGDGRAILNAVTILRRLLIQNGYSSSIITSRDLPRNSPGRFYETEKRGQSPSGIDVEAVFANLREPKSSEPVAPDYDAALAQFQALHSQKLVETTTKPAPARPVPATASSSTDDQTDRQSAQTKVESKSMPPSSSKPAMAAAPSSKPAMTAAPSSKPAMTAVNEAISSSKPTPATENEVEVHAPVSEQFLVYTPTPEYVPAEVIIIRVENALIAMGGDCLVIPIHAMEKVTVLSHLDAMTRYMPKPKPEQAVSHTAPSSSRRSMEQDAPPKSITPVKLSVETPVVTETAPPEATAPVKPPPEATAPAQSPAEATAPVQPSAEATAPVQSPAEATAPDFAFPVANKRVRAQSFGREWVSPETSNPSEVTASKIVTISEAAASQPLIEKLIGKSYIPLQLARMLVALYHCQTERELEWVTSNDIKDFLTEVDFKQFSARMPYTVTHGLAIRTPRPKGAGYRWKLTKNGNEIAVALNFDPQQIRGKRTTGAWVSG